MSTFATPTCADSSPDDIALPEGGAVVTEIGEIATGPKKRTRKSAAPKAPKVPKVPKAPTLPFDDDLSVSVDELDEEAVDVPPPLDDRTTKGGRKRSEFAPPEKTWDGMTLLDYLSTCTPALDSKIIDIALNTTRIPSGIRSEAAQEIRFAWLSFKPNLKYKPGQIASYAHRMAIHSTLRLWRELGSAVRLPGSAFRKKRDGSTYVEAGHIASPLDWNDTDEWLNTEDLHDYSATRQLRPDELLDELSGTKSKLARELGLPNLPQTETDILYLKMAAKIEDCRRSLRPYPENREEHEALDILTRLVKGDTYDQVAADLGILRAAVIRKLDCVAPLIK